MISSRSKRRTTKLRSHHSGSQGGPRGGSRRYPRTNSRATHVLKRDLAIVAAIGSLLSMLYVFEYAAVARAGYERAALRTEIRGLQARNSNLRADVEILERPQRIDAIARKLGMVQRSDADFIALAPLPVKPREKDHRMIAGFLPEWLNKLLEPKR